MCGEDDHIVCIRRELTWCFLSRLEDYDVDEEDEEALIEQRRLQRLAIVQVGDKTSIISSSMH